MTPEQLRAVQRASGILAPAVTRSHALTTNGNAKHDDLDDDHSWAETSLTEWLDGKQQTIAPTLLRRDDGEALFYRGVNWLFGDSGEGKSMVLAIGAKQEFALGNHVVWVDLEDPTPLTLIERLRMFGVADEIIDRRLHRIAPNSEFTDRRVDGVIATVRQWKASLVVVDSLGEAFGLDGIDEDRDFAVGPWLRRVIRRIADESETCVVVVDHSTKAKENRLYPSGSKRKRAAVTGHSVLVEAMQPLTRESGGKLHLITAKDRGGHFGRGDVAAVVDLYLYPDGGINLRIDTPQRRDPAHEASAKLRWVARAAARAAKSADRPLSKNELVVLMRPTMRGGTDVLRAGIDAAVADGALRVEKGSRNASLHFYVRDLVDDQPRRTAP